MSIRALHRRSREARAWLLDAMVPLWCAAAVERDGTVLAGLDLNHRAPDEQRSDPLAAWRLASGLARVRRFDPGNTMASETLEAIFARDLTGPDSETLAVRSAWLLACGLAQDGAGPGQRSLPGTLGSVVTAANDQAMRLVGGKAFKAAGLPDWLDACLALALSDPGGRHLGRASSLVAAVIGFLGASPGGLFIREGESADVAEQFDWYWRLASHARAIGTALPSECDRLHDFAVSTLDDEGVTPALADLDGSPVAGPVTLAGQSAALMAHLNRLRTGNSVEPAQRAMASFDALMDNHLTPEGGWISAYDADGLPIDHAMATRDIDLVVRPFTALIDISAAW